MTYENETASFAAMKRDLDDVVDRGIRAGRPVSGSMLGDRRVFQTATAQRETVFAETRTTLEQTRDFALRVVELADRLCGPTPAQDAAGNPSAGGPAFDMMRRDLETARRLVLDADSALTRIERELL